jgi:hypothetical protein
MLKTISILSGILLIISAAFAQPATTHEHKISVNYLQIKESLNYGLVFKGPGLNYEYLKRWEYDKNQLTYTGRFGFSYLETRDIAAANINLVPVNLNYLFKPKPEKEFFIGPTLLVDYNYELYPDLQSGYSFWFTHMSVGVKMLYKFNLQSNLFQVELGTTLFGITSRAKQWEDPYYYDLSFGDVIKYLHQDMQFGSFGQYNHSELEIRYKPNAGSRWALAYNFQYYGYFDEPRLDMINQYLKVILMPKRKKDEKS